MRLAIWRKQQTWTLARLGQELGFGGSNPAREAQRIERGERNVDADLAERIRQLTGDAVRIQDLHEARLEWLREAASSGGAVSASEPERRASAAPAALSPAKSEAAQ